MILGQRIKEEREKGSGHKIILQKRLMFLVRPFLSRKSEVLIPILIV